MTEHSDITANPYLKRIGIDVKENNTIEDLLYCLASQHGQHLARLFIVEWQLLSIKEKLARYENEHSNSLALLIENETQKFQLEQLSEQVRKADIAKGEFLANMSHEIKTPLNGIIGFADLLKESNLDKDQRNFLDMVKKCGEALLALISDILDFSKIEARKITLEKIEFDIESTAFEVCDLIATRIGDKKIDIICDIQADLPSNLIGDPLRFSQVLINLMGNAVKFTDSGEIVLSVSLQEVQKNRVKILASVRDTGIGIPSENLPFLFNPFQQADSSISRKFGGTGLGLSISKRLAQIMGGDIRAESQPGQGSTFYFSAWLDKPEKPVIKKYSMIPCANRKVLVFDTSETSLQIISGMLKQFSIQVAATNKEKDVLNLLIKADADGEPFDVCLLGVRPTEPGGFNIAKQIRKAGPPYKCIPVIAVTSYGKYNAIEFDGFLHKPIQRDKLFALLKRLLNRKSP